MTQERDSGYFGVIATMDVYGYDLKEGQMSSGSIYVTNFEGQNNDQIVVGWMVSCLFFLFIRLASCYNIL
jgi:hypothetical protein